VTRSAITLDPSPLGYQVFDLFYFESISVQLLTKEYKEELSLPARDLLLASRSIPDLFTGFTGKLYCHLFLWYRSKGFLI
jgi:hypothetical protein